MHSEGYHPKMIVSYLPALPLGMEGKSEVMEFKSRYRFAEDQFILRLNRFVPQGLEFLRLERLEPEAPTLNESLAEFVYSLDLSTVDVRSALKEFRRGSREPGMDDDRTVRAMVDEWISKKGESASMLLNIGLQGAKLVMSIEYSPQKLIRPQDVIEEIFGMEQSVFDMAREHVNLKSR